MSYHHLHRRRHHHSVSPVASFLRILHAQIRERSAIRHWTDSGVGTVNLKQLIPGKKLPVNHSNTSTRHSHSFVACRWNYRKRE